MLCAMLIDRRLVACAHDVSDGGLFTALVEMGSPRGLGFDVESDSEVRLDAFLFGEAQGRIVVTTTEADQEDFSTSWVRRHSRDALGAHHQRQMCRGRAALWFHW